MLIIGVAYPYPLGDRRATNATRTSLLRYRARAARGLLPAVGRTAIRHDAVCPYGAAARPAALATHGRRAAAPAAGVHGAHAADGPADGAGRHPVPELAVLRGEERYAVQPGEARRRHADASVACSSAGVAAERRVAAAQTPYSLRGHPGAGGATGGIFAVHPHRLRHAAGGELQLHRRPRVLSGCPRCIPLRPRPRLQRAGSAL